MYLLFYFCVLFFFVNICSSFHLFPDTLQNGIVVPEIDMGLVEVYLYLSIQSRVDLLAFSIPNWIQKIVLVFFFSSQNFSTKEKKSVVFYNHVLFILSSTSFENVICQFTSQSNKQSRYTN